jgi:hypothetical protein
MLFEALIAAVVLVVGLLGLYGLLDDSVKASASTHQREGAVNLARQILEDARGIPYAEISASAIVGELQALPGLKNEGSSSSWQVVRSNTTYTITVKECPIDDGKGGVWGVHKNVSGENYFCKDTGEEEWKEGKPGPDTQPEDLKRITAVVTWSAHGRTPEVRQVETVSAAGAAPGLSATSLYLESPTPDQGTTTAPVITKATTATLKFAVTAPSGTAAMRWSLEGVAQSTAPTLKEGTTWTFSWAIPDPGVSDGTYTVAVQAIDKRGVLGPPVSITVTLVRNVPSEPTGIKGGFNNINVAGVSKQVVELQWQANGERNIIGYRVYRKEGANRALACPTNPATLSTTTSCIDLAPSQPFSENRVYEVIALYHNQSSEIAEGKPASFTVIGGPPPAPEPPTGLTLTPNGEGGVVLHWTAPTGGPAVLFYRIYRGSINYTSRYDIATGTEYVDTNALEPHTYWVTAVDANLTESPFTESVTG